MKKYHSLYQTLAAVERPNTLFTVQSFQDIKSLIKVIQHDNRVGKKSTDFNLKNLITPPLMFYQHSKSFCFYLHLKIPPPFFPIINEMHTELFDLQACPRHRPRTPPVVAAVDILPD